MSENDLEEQASSDQNQVVIPSRLRSFQNYFTGNLSDRYRDESYPMGNLGDHPPSEALPHNGDVDLTRLRRQAISVLFGLDSKFVQSWAGGIVFCTHLERMSSLLVTHKYDVINEILGSRGSPNQHQCWKWCFAVLAASQKLARDNTTIDGIYNQLVRDHDMARSTPLRLTQDRLHEARRAIFAVLCWISATLTPLLEKQPAISSGSGTTVTPSTPTPWVQNSDHVLPNSDFKRPTAKIFRGFRAMINDHAAGTAMIYPTGVHEDAILESRITYISLHRIGHVRLSIIAELLPKTSGYTLQDPKDVHREVLLSYRVLFAQSSRSRTLIKKHLQRACRDNEDIDPFLVILCTKSLSFLRKKVNLPKDVFPYSALDLEGFLSESETYSANDDFPFFGHKLQALQRYNLRQQPSKVKDLWRDRRNPLQWYTFWIVLWVGGISIILSVVQIGLAAAQVYYSM
ncbi:hypothetical protein FSPOR_6843 [Fusarium sporotrichioides]|uniref:Uncharacterized protein n=1 Tax=Fusarium sporotrichioides TaxID=5514 RepID=A0A395S199_FUSSP|nr:hypothetical protein FSPOR_6843 [Fusarium sporotrichioides]